MPEEKHFQRISRGSRRRSARATQQQIRAFLVQRAASGSLNIRDMALNSILRGMNRSDRSRHTTARGYVFNRNAQLMKVLKKLEPGKLNIYGSFDEKANLLKKFSVIKRYIHGKSLDSFSLNDQNILRPFINLSPEEQSEMYNDLESRAYHFD